MDFPPYTPPPPTPKQLRRRLDSARKQLKKLEALRRRARQVTIDIVVGFGLRLRCARAAHTCGRRTTQVDTGPLRVPLDLALRQIFNYLHNGPPVRFGALNTDSGETPGIIVLRSQSRTKSKPDASKICTSG